MKVVMWGSIIGALIVSIGALNWWIDNKKAAFFYGELEPPLPTKNELVNLVKDLDNWL